MLFSSIPFLYFFLPIVLLFYFVLFRKSRLLQNVWLLIVSLIFYAWGEPKFVLIMIASIFINWGIGLLVSHYQEQKKMAKTMVAIDVAVNLLILFAFKYLNFAEGIFCSIFGTARVVPSIALPIGISFFTFQAMSYVIDVYRGKGKAQKNVLYVGLYISFFPQLIAGPIVRYETVAEEILYRKETLDDFFNGFARFVVGLCKKVLLSNSFALLADLTFDSVHNGEVISGSYAWLGAIAYTLQILYDFSGYSDMAIGLGKMFGFHFLENFKYPYAATSISDFWRRWHISLGSWFRDYVYFPLGGSRVSKWRNVLNLFVVWTLTGIWHGANYTFVLWGILFFVLIAGEKLTGFEKKLDGNRWIIPRWIYTMFFVVLGWVLFRAESISDAFSYMKLMFCFNGFFDNVFWGYLSQYALTLFVGILLTVPIVGKIREKAEKTRWFGWVNAVLLALLFVLSVASLVSNSYNPFIYFNF